ncbi:hypothetical protein E8E15_001332 [Penicillium rubens]|nr:hypothetical protein E8E15_001332 [Penicillium rubens]
MVGSPLVPVNRYNHMRLKNQMSPSYLLRRTLSRKDSRTRLHCAFVMDSMSKSSENTPKQSLAFPPMFIANVNGCITRENVDIRFPWPGSVVEYNGDSKYRPKEGEPVCTGNPTFGPIPVTDTVDTSENDSTTGSSNSIPCSCGCQCD